MPGSTLISCSLRFSQSGICGRQRPQKSTKGGSYSRRPLPFLPNPHPFFCFLPIPYPFRRLLRRLCESSEYTTELKLVSHLTLFQICLSIEYLNFLGGFLKKCIAHTTKPNLSFFTVRQLDKMHAINKTCLPKYRRAHNRNKRERKRTKNIGIRGLKNDLKKN